MRGRSPIPPGQTRLANQTFHVSMATCERRALFLNIACGRAVVWALRHEHDAGRVCSHAFVVMPDHLHWLVSLRSQQALSDTIESVKTISAERIRRILARSDKVWQQCFHDRIIGSDDDIPRVARYIVSNPIRAGIVGSLRNYPLWDSRELRAGLRETNSPQGRGRIPALQDNRRCAQLPFEREAGSSGHGFL